MRKILVAENMVRPGVLSFQRVLAAENNLPLLLKAMGDRNCGILSAYRTDLNFAENQSRQQALYNDIKRSGFGYIPLQGVWVDKKTQEERAEESCLITSLSDPEEFLKFMKSLMHKYEQDAVLVKLENEREAFLHYSSGGAKNIGKLRLNTLSNELAKVKGEGEKKFEFRSCTAYVESGVNGWCAAVGASATRRTLILQHAGS